MSELSERAQKLEQQLERTDYPDSWRPREEGDHPRRLVGTFERLEVGNTRQYGEKAIVVLRDLSGKEWSVWLLHAVLEREFRQLRPRRGELVAVSYEGHVPAKGDRPGYEKFKVAVDRRGDSADWDQIGRPEAASHFAGVETPAEAPAAQPPAAAEQPVAPRQAEPGTDVECNACGMRNGFHKADCPLDTIPF